MIIKYYASHIKNMIDEYAINVRRSTQSFKVNSATPKPRNLNY